MRSEVDGVPVFWTPSASRYMGAIEFRVGRMDETFATGGITHLVEHLAFHGLGGQLAFPANGFVDLGRTVFHAAGSPAEVTSFLGSVCRSLQSLRFDRLPAENRVLRAEARGRVPGRLEHHLVERYGLRGPGLSFAPEHALGRVAAEDIADWAARWFTRGNAAVWLSGPPSTDLRLELPDGPRIEASLPSTIQRSGSPGWFQGPPDCGVSVSFTGLRDDWVKVPIAIVRERAQERLRHGRGISYSVIEDYRPLDRDTAHAMIDAICLDTDAGAVQATVLDLMDRIATDGPTPQEIEQQAEQFARSAHDPDSILSELDAAVFGELVGRPAPSMEQLHAELLAMRPADVASTMGLALTTALMAVPPTVSTTRYEPRPGLSPHRFTGRVFQSATRRYPWSPASVELTVANDGVGLVTPDGAVHGVRYADLVGLVVEDANSLMAVAGDGFQVTVRASDWKQGEAALRELRRAVPSHLIIEQAPEV